MGEYLNFTEISKVGFEKILELLKLPYTRTNNGEIKGECFIISLKKNQYFNPTGSDKGSVINFVAAQKGMDLRSAAKLIKDEFLTPKEEPKRQIPVLELEYHPFLEEIAPPDLCQGLNVGFCKQKSIMNGRICFKVGANGYVGYNPDDKSWLFPKSFKRDTLWNIENCDQDLILVTNDLFDALKLVNKGYHYTASIMGINPTEEQKQILQKYPFVFYKG